MDKPKNNRFVFKILVAIVFGIITFLFASSPSYHFYNKFWIFFLISIFIAISAFMDFKSNKALKVLLMFFVSIIYIGLWFISSLKSWHW